jgi:hypothetical protein
MTLDFTLSIILDPQEGSKNYHNCIHLAEQFPESFIKKGDFIYLNTDNLFSSKVFKNTLSNYEGWPQNAPVLNINTDPNSPSWNLCYRSKIKRGDFLNIKGSERNVVLFTIYGNGSKYDLWVKEERSRILDTIALTRVNNSEDLFAFGKINDQFFGERASYQSLKEFVSVNTGYHISSLLLEYEDFDNFGDKPYVPTYKDGGELRVIMELE